MTKRNLQPYPELFLIILLITCIFVNLSSNINASEPVVFKPRSLQYTPHAPCRINSDAEFDTSPCKTGGNGKQNDPYIIEGWDINGTGYRYALYIGNTTSHFIVRKNYFHHANGNYSNFYRAGLFLYRVENGEITDNNASHNYEAGFILESSSHNMITNNTCYNNAGIFLNSSAFNNIIHNTAFKCARGIVLALSNSNNIANNSVFRSGFDGILLSSSNDNIIVNNTVTDSSDGISTVHSNFNRIIGNNATKNYRGIDIDKSENNNITNNIVSYNQAGILLGYSNYNNISNNIAFNNSWDGIALCNSSNNLITRNNASNYYNNASSFPVGIYIYESSNSNEIVNNEIFGNSDSGIRFYNLATNNLVHHNYLMFNNGSGKQAKDSVGGNHWNDSSEGNYWSDFDEPSEGCNDNDSNGICDAPYLLLGGTNSKDEYPLTEKFLIIPIILSTNPKDGLKNVSLDTKIILTFNIRMDRFATEGAITSTPNIQWTPSWNSNDTILTCVPSSKLIVNTNYIITISTFAKGANGIFLKKPYSFGFMTLPFIDIYPPYVISTYPINGSKDIDPTTNITITFNETMNVTSVEKAVSISNTLISTIKWDASQKIIILTANLTRGKCYHVRVANDARDIAGNLMVTSYSFEFATINDLGSYSNETMLIIFFTIILLIILTIIGYILFRKRGLKICSNCKTRYLAYLDACPRCESDKGKMEEEIKRNKEKNE